MLSVHNDPAQSADSKTDLLPYLVLVAVLLLLVIRRAWVTEDAYITYRVVDNFIHGYGLTFNVVERVQAYTHPLWMLIFSLFYLFTREAFYTSIVLCVGLTAAAVILATTRLTKSHWSAMVVIWTLCLSNAFIDYSTSGLENALSHLLVVVFCLLYWEWKPTRGHLIKLSLVAALLTLTRQDLVLIVLPAVLVRLWQMRSWRALGWAALGQIPLVVWEIFSIIYYGFPFPNTYYAKLFTGLPSNEIITQGWLYLLTCLRNDPLTILAIAAGLALPLILRRRDSYPLVLGGLLYLAYTIRIGGDFMEGRFFSVVLLLALLQLLREDMNRLSTSGLLMLALAVTTLGVTVPHPTYRVFDALTDGDTVNGIMNERLYYAATNSLLSTQRGSKMPEHNFKWIGYAYRADPDEAPVENVVGMAGYFAGPGVHIIDDMALSDPLLARLPALADPFWRIGHFRRMVPEGYQATVSTGTLSFSDQNLKQFYAHLLEIISGPLFTRERWVMIWRFNTGYYNHLINQVDYAYPNRQKIDLSQLGQAIPDGTAYDAPGIIAITNDGLDVLMDEVHHQPCFRTSLDNNDDYVFTFYLGQNRLASVTVPAGYRSIGLNSHEMKIPDIAWKTGYDHILIKPGHGDGMFGLGNVVLTQP